MPEDAEVERGSSLPGPTPRVVKGGAVGLAKINRDAKAIAERREPENPYMQAGLALQPVAATPVANQPAPETPTTVVTPNAVTPSAAPTVAAPSGRKRGVKPGDVTMSANIPQDLRNRVRNTFAATRDAEGDYSFNEMIAKLVERECVRREQLYNGGQRFPERTRPLPRGVGFSS